MLRLKHFCQTLVHPVTHDPTHFGLLLAKIVHILFAFGNGCEWGVGLYCWRLKLQLTRVFSIRCWIFVICCRKILEYMKSQRLMLN